MVTSSAEITETIINGEPVGRAELKRGNIVFGRPSSQYKRGILVVDKVTPRRVTAYYLGQDGQPITDDSSLKGPVRLTEDEYRRVSQETVNMAVGHYARKKGTQPAQVVTQPPQVCHLWFVDKDGRPRRVCEKKHKPGKECTRPHAVPADALWSGRVQADLKGELIEQARECRKVTSSALHRWKRRRAKLVKKQSTSAPAFRPYIDQLIEKHDGERPALVVTIDAARLVNA